MRSNVKKGGKAVRAAGVVLVSLMLTLWCIGLTGCGYCAHKLEVEDEKVPSTCIESGHAYTYRCQKCNKLFAYTEEKGLYEVGAAEQLPLSAQHVLPDTAAETTQFGARLKEGKSGQSLFDYEVYTRCLLCGRDYAVPEENLVSYVPPMFAKNNSAGSRIYNGTRVFDENAQRWYTEIKLYKNARPGDIVEINPYTVTNTNKPYNPDTNPTLDPGWEFGRGAYQRLPLYMPFNSDQDPRHLVFVIFNKSETVNIKIEWSSDGENWGSAVVGAGEYKPLYVVGSRGTTNVDAQFMRMSNADGGDTLGANVDIEMTGFFYTAGQVDKLDIDSPPAKTNYREGETFDPTGMKIYAIYTDQFLGKTLAPSECELSVSNRPLTEKDTKVVVSYGGKRVSLPITVTKEGE